MTHDDVLLLSADVMGKPQTIEDYRALQAAIFGGRDWIVALDVLASATFIIRELRERGAEQCLAIGASRGAGDLPDAEWGPEPIELGVTADSMMAGIRAAQEALANLPADAVARVDEFDPDHEVRVIGTIFDDGSPVAGRTKFGRRQDAWRALEDKIVIDALWEELGVAHAPYRIVPATRTAMAQASSELDQGLGCVWAGDARSGFHGGATFTRWVRTEADEQEVADYFADYCDHARVMPFLEGIPCSIHGMVFPDYVLAGRPCEMLVLRSPETSSLRYATAATFWDPADADREYMRELVREVGDHLRNTVDYRGTFTIDGVMTSEGFRPTELNPRFGGAFGKLEGGMNLGLIFIDLAVMEGIDVDWNPRRLEEVLVANGDKNRRGSSNMVFEMPTTDQTTLGLVMHEDHVEVVEADDPNAHVTVLRGPATAGTFIRLVYIPENIPAGPSVAPLTARAIAKLDDLWDLSAGLLQPAIDVR